MHRFAGVWLALCALASVAAGQLADFGARRAAARAALLHELERYAEWCKGATLFQERRRALELVIELSPEHEEALRTLGYTREKDGRWTPPAKPKTFRDFDKQALEEAPGRFAALRSGYVAALLALLSDPGLSAEQRELVLADILHYDPDNERVHGLLGEVKSDKGWVLPETVRARERRAEIRALVREGLEGAPQAEPAPLTERERAFRLPLVAFATPSVRVVGTVGEDELLLMAQALHGLEHLLQGAFRTEYGLPRDCTVFLLADPAEKRPFLERHPAIAPEQRALYDKLEGAGIQGTADFAFWTGDTQRRIDGVVRLVLGFLFTGAFELTVDQGWAYEGFGILLTRSLVRSRMTWLAQPARLDGSEGDFKLRQRLIDPDSNWVDEAYQLLQEKRQPPLAELFKKSASQLGTEDVLHAYALATYFLEARAEETPKILARLGAGVGGARAIEEALGMKLDEFERRLTRWLSERT